MAPGPSKRRHSGLPKTPSPPASHKRVRSLGGTSSGLRSAAQITRNDGSYSASGSGSNPATSSRAKGKEKAKDKGKGKAAADPYEPFSLMADRTRALAEAYTRTGLDAHGPTSYTPVRSQAASSQDNAGGPSRHVPEEMRLGCEPLNAMGLGIPHALHNTAAEVRKLDLERELQFQAQFPPVLPASNVEDLEPKEPGEPLIPVPENATEEEKQFIEVQNNDITDRNKDKDRERNNKAAKKSRELRIESLDRNRKMLIASTAETNWLRLRLIAIGDVEGLAIWEDLKRSGKAAKVVQEISDRLCEIDTDRDDAKKAKESTARQTLNARRASLQLSASISGSTSRDQSASQVPSISGTPTRDFEAPQEVGKIRALPATAMMGPIAAGDVITATPSRILTYDRGVFDSPELQVAGQAYPAIGVQTPVASSANIGAHSSDFTSTFSPGLSGGQYPVMAPAGYTGHPEDLALNESPAGIAAYSRQMLDLPSDHMFGPGASGDDVFSPLLPTGVSNNSLYDPDDTFIQDPALLGMPSYAGPSQQQSGQSSQQYLAGQYPLYPDFGDQYGGSYGDQPPPSEYVQQARQVPHYDTQPRPEYCRQPAQEFQQQLQQLQQQQQGGNTQYGASQTNFDARTQGQQ